MQDLLFRIPFKVAMADKCFIIPKTKEEKRVSSSIPGKAVQALQAVQIKLGGKSLSVCSSTVTEFDPLAEPTEQLAMLLKEQL